MEETRAFRITGRVQGVGYRAWMSRTARNLGLKGFVRNEEDGSVYAEATGTPQALQQLEKLCWMGPASSHVEQVHIIPLNTRHNEDFYIMR
jgi:acylphosphatase